MAKCMGIYCKAYLLLDLRSYPKWREQADGARQLPSTDGNDGGARSLADSDIVYIQENYVVTDGIFKEENVLFDSIDADWIAFCEQRLGFAIPEDVLSTSLAESA